MGFKYFSDDPGCSSNPNPNPYFCKIIKKERTSGGLWIVTVLYYNCTTFSGKKLLLMTKEPAIPIDPHILEDGVVIARFEPTERGYNMAKKSSCVR